MGKIVKFCSTCDEGFAEKFAFCPNCASALQAFEMNPVAPVVNEPAPAEVEPVVEVSAAPKTVVFEEPLLEIEEPVRHIEPEPETVTFQAPAEEWSAADYVYEDVSVPTEETPVVHTVEEPIDVDRIAPTTQFATVGDEDFHVTVIDENKNSGTRNSLMLGTLGMMLVALMVAFVASIFSKDLDVGSINDDIFNAVIVDVEPMQTEEVKEQKKDEDDAGGGGGGGREEEETTQGDLANQTKDPVRPPQAIPRLENPSLVLPPASTQGDRKFEQKFDRYGDPNGRFASWQNGTGTGGGQGSGYGTGQGSGRGTGAGSGTGSGYGGGLGSGNGDGTGGGDSSDGGPPPEVRKGVTAGMKILSKPRPGYTDAARQNNVTGTVVLRVTFLGSGQIGSVSVVKGLPNGLSEQAIAAARRISFEPQKINGVGQTVTKQVEYSFSIY